MRQIVRAFIKNNEKKYLLVKHIWKDMWTLPWWHLEDKEDIFSCIKREIKEELNLEIKLVWKKLKFESEKIIKSYPEPICSYKIEFESKKYGLQNKIEYIFLAKIKSDLIDLKADTKEIAEYDFFSLKEILKLENIYPQIQEIVKYLKK